MSRSARSLFSTVVMLAAIPLVMAIPIPNVNRKSTTATYKPTGSSGGLYKGPPASKKTTIIISSVVGGIVFLMVAFATWVTCMRLKELDEQLEATMKKIKHTGVGFSAVDTHDRDDEPLKKNKTRFAFWPWKKSGTEAEKTTEVSEAGSNQPLTLSTADRLPSPTHSTAPLLSPQTPFSDSASIVSMSTVSEEQHVTYPRVKGV